LLRGFRIGVVAVVLAMAGLATAQTVRGTHGNDWLYGTAQADAIYGYAGEDFLYGGRGNDHLDGGRGQDHVKGGPGNDTIFGGSGGEPVTESNLHAHHEYIRGNEGDDVIVVRGAGTLVWGGAGNDRIDIRDPKNSCKLPFGRGVLRTLDPPHCVDLVNTGTGDNFVRADDGNYDGIDCFGRRDRVIVDQHDHVSACEVVKRVKR
jgi:hypothetical protein